MNRLIIGLVMVLTAGAAFGYFTSVAEANGGPHGDYAANTSKCAACHRAHTAVGAELIVAEDQYALCTSCHDGTVADTNVLDGILGTEGTTPINAGGFEFMPMLGYPGDPAGYVSEAVTSTHTVEGLGGASGVGTAWGSLGPDGEGPGVSGVLECSSCHNPHGSTNYRILKDTSNGHGAPPGWYGDGEDGSHDMATCSDGIDNGDADGADLADASFDCQWSYLNAWQDEQVLATDNLVGGSNQYSTPGKSNFTSGMNNFCGSCHTEYVEASHSAGDYGGASASAPYDAGDGKGTVPRFRHATVRSYGGSRPVRFAAMDTSATDGDPMAWTDTDGDGYWDPGEVWDETNSVNETARRGFNCLQCHFAHGSAASMSGYANDGSGGVAPTDDSALLYYDNRGTCRACHQTTK